MPGFSLAVVKDDKVVFAKGYGVRELGKAEAVDADTLFAIASNTKAFTSAALAVLVDEGKLKWDDPVSKYLPSFQLYDPFVTREITVRDLLSHRSGLATFGGDLLWFESSYPRAEIIRRVRHLKPTSSFRSAYGTRTSVSSPRARSSRREGPELGRLRARALLPPSACGADDRAQTTPRRADIATPTTIRGKPAYTYDDGTTRAGRRP